MRTARSEETLIALGAIASLVVAVVWAGWRWRHLPKLEIAATIGMSPYAPRARKERSESALSRWHPPEAQPRGPEWVFDLFTPPEIFFNADSRQFTVIPPNATTDEPPRSAPVAFGLRLAQVQRLPFRVQLVGFVGDGVNLAGLFENVATTEHFIARPGQRIEALTNVALSLREVSISRGPGASSSGATGEEKKIRATVHDELTAEDVCLAADERIGSAELIATFVSDASPNQTFEARVGEVVTAAGATFRVMSLRLTPAEANLTKSFSDSNETERRTLTASPLVPQQRQPSP